jgi:hypothetical protein
VFIEKSYSPWLFLIILALKNGGILHLCVDCRKLNDITRKDKERRFPLPRIDNTLDMLTGAKWFSSLDLKCSYLQVDPRPDNKEKTAFSMGQGVWEFSHAL